MTLREIRKSAGLTQQDLANQACVARAAISHVESERYSPSARFAGRVCRALSNIIGARIDTWDLFPEQFSRLTS